MLVIYLDLVSMHSVVSIAMADISKIVCAYACCGQNGIVEVGFVMDMAWPVRRLFVLCVLYFVSFVVNLQTADWSI